MTLFNSTDALRHDKDALIRELRVAGARVFGDRKISCPFHEDKNPSSEVYEKDGVWRFKCFAGSCGFCGDVFDVRSKATGISVDDILKSETEKLKQDEPKPKPEKLYTQKEIESFTTNGNHEASYQYTHPETKAIELLVIRFRDESGKKHFMQATPRGDKFALKGIAKNRPLYNRARVKKSNKVIVCEGEKCVHALQSIGIISTTSPGGAECGSLADWQPLAGKDVYLWPDNDEAGFKYIEMVKSCLKNLTPRPVIYTIEVRYMGMPEKGDAADYVEILNGMQPADKKKLVLDLMADAIPEESPTDDLKRLIIETSNGVRRTIPFSHDILTRLSKALIPGTVTLLCGDPGCSKSLFIIQEAIQWYMAGLKLAIYELEEDQNYHLYRTLAVKEKRASIQDDEWLTQNKDHVLGMLQKDRAFFDGFGACIFDAPEKQINYEMLINWITEKSKSGNEIIIVDPITAIESSGKPWIADTNFIIAVKTIARKYHNRLILVTHLKQRREKEAGFESIAGGAAFSRFCQTVLTIQSFPGGKDLIVKKSSQSESLRIKANRKIRITKARNSYGGGVDVAYLFNKNTMNFEEFGWIQKGIKDE